MSAVLATLSVLFIIIMLPVVIVTVHKGMKRGVLRAVEIAQHQGWVSPYRLMAQAGLTKMDAQLVLQRACKQGLLFQAANGRYYLPEMGARSNYGTARSVTICPSHVLACRNGTEA